MLIELAVRDLGVIAEARVPFSGGMTALTGETGAGKTMIVESLQLLSGGRADPSRVRAGATEAVVEGLFVVGDTEWVLRRVVPAEGRSRCYLNGELSTAATLAEVAAGLLEVHGQHGQQALLSPRHHREALDRFAGIDRRPLDEARRRLRALAAELEGLGGDERARQRQIDLLAHQVAEIEGLGPRPGEDEGLSAEEDLLGDALAHREAAAGATAMLSDDGAAADLVAQAAAVLEGRAPFTAVRDRLVDLQAELSDCGAELRDLGEGIEPDEARLAEVRSRRHALVELRRKYGDTVEEVLAFAAGAGRELDELRSLDDRREAVTVAIDAARGELTAVGDAVGTARREAAPRLGAAVAEVLAGLALPGAVVEVAVQDTAELAGAGEAVEIRICTNPGGRPDSLARVASGGELSRVMLALRLVLSGGPPTMVFDEVDAGIGGAAATTVGRALGRLGGDRQVLVVTHLAQVAAAADHQVLVDKQRTETSTTTSLRVVEGDDRVAEVARMLSGSPDSRTAIDHAAEMLESAATDRASTGRR